MYKDQLNEQKHIIKISKKVLVHFPDSYKNLPKH